MAEPKPITSSALYPMFYIAMAETCRKYGYALAVHGSLGRDFDLIAAPWVEDAVDAEMLVQKLKEECELMEGNNTNTEKPCGRKCYVFVAFAEYRAGYIDLSIMPKVKLNSATRRDGDE